VAAWAVEHGHIRVRTALGEKAAPLEEANGIWVAWACCAIWRPKKRRSFILKIVPERNNCLCEVFCHRKTAKPSAVLNATDGFAFRLPMYRFLGRHPGLSDGRSLRP